MNLHQHTRGPAFNPIEGGRYRYLIICVVVAFTVIFAGVSETANAAGAAANVDAPRMTAADRDPANWMSYGR